MDELDFCHWQFARHHPCLGLSLSGPDTDGYFCWIWLRKFHSRLAPDDYASEHSRFAGDFLPDDIKPLEQLLAEKHHEIAALILEPIVQGYGGMRFYHPEYLRRARALCDKYQVLLIADEIATGFGRTGKLFAMEHSGVEPDLITMAKGIAGGLPLAAVVGKSDIMDAPLPGGLGGTYGGSPVACAAALGAIGQCGCVEISPVQLTQFIWPGVAQKFAGALHDLFETDEP